MKVFISWSGNRSRAIAEALNDWLQRVIQAVEPFYTPYMEKGVKWSNEIDDALEGTRFSIVCLTPDNLNSRWIHYETGALSKTKDAVIWTFLHGLTVGDVPQPLGRFQHTIAEKSDILKLLQSINSRLREVGTGALKDDLLEEIFEESWSKLEIRLREAEMLSDKKILTYTNKSEKVRDEKDVLNEILEVVRDQQRRLDSLEENILRIPEVSTANSSKIMNEKIRNAARRDVKTEFTGVIFTVAYNAEEEEKLKEDLATLLNHSLVEGHSNQVTQGVNEFQVQFLFYTALQKTEFLPFEKLIFKVFKDKIAIWKPYYYEIPLN